MRSVQLGALVVAYVLTTASPAFGLAVVSPTDGDAVPSRPTFTLDAEAQGASLTVEVARTSELLTAGYRTGWFVDPVESNIGFFDRPPLNALQWDTGRLPAGKYFWRSLIKTYDENPVSVWSAVQTFYVEDEPPIIEGWTLRAERLRRRPTCRDTLWRLRGRVAYTDNDRTPRVRLALLLRHPAVTRTLRAPLDYGDRFDVLVCTRKTRITVTPVLTDRVGQAVRGQARPLRAAT